MKQPLLWDRTPLGWNAYEILAVPESRRVRYRLVREELSHRRLLATLRPLYGADGLGTSLGWVAATTSFYDAREFLGATALEDAKLYVEALFALKD